jgi:hypothetical protein
VSDSGYSMLYLAKKTPVVDEVSTILTRNRSKKKEKDKETHLHRPNDIIHEATPTSTKRGAIEHPNTSFQYQHGDGDTTTTLVSENLSAIAPASIDRIIVAAVHFGCSCNGSACEHDSSRRGTFQGLIVALTIICLVAVRRHSSSVVPVVSSRDLSELEIYIQESGRTCIGSCAKGTIEQPNSPH